MKRLPDDALKELKKVADEITLKVATTTDIVGRVYESLDKFREQSKAYLDISELALYEASSLK